MSWWHFRRQFCVYNYASAKKKKKKFWNRVDCQRSEKRSKDLLCVFGSTHQQLKTFLSRGGQARWSPIQCLLSRVQIPSEAVSPVLPSSPAFFLILAIPSFPPPCRGSPPQPFPTFQSIDQYLEKVEVVTDLIAGDRSALYRTVICTVSSTLGLHASLITVALQLFEQGCQQEEQSY